MHTFEHNTLRYNISKSGLAKHILVIVTKIEDNTRVKAIDLPESYTKQEIVQAIYDIT